MQLFSCNYFYLLTIILFINSMTVFTAHHKRHEAIIDGKRLMGLSMEDLQRTVKLYNKIMEDPSAYYESVSHTGQGQNTSALIESSQNKSTEPSKNVNGIMFDLNNTTEMTFTPANLNYEFLLQELNRKIENLTIPLTSLTTVRGGEIRSSVASKVVKTQNKNSSGNFTTDGNHDLTSSTIVPTLAYSNPSYFVSNPVLKTTQKPEIYSPTSISGLLENQKEIIKRLLINIDAAQKVLTTPANGLQMATSVDSNSSWVPTTESFRMSGESDIPLNRTNGGPINDISTILMKLAEVESNASIKNGDDRKQKSKNPFTALLKKFLKTKNFAEVQQI
ncbi:hypothetical protein LSTR_LSTR011277 [Laodelphax striatellus]|uniref:Uncharacterized protein n=1 Tax=Laodelphax striatellus TaxID=195883 RepID=A0A482XJJ9_LAOST|nr:hypothetical protein LSTR_LSTR011277 [Laodelphax striatellus]